MSEARARFRVGQPIQHKRFAYRGVIVDVDPVFCGTEAWYEAMATSRPPKDRPWYHVLVHDGARVPNECMVRPGSARLFRLPDVGANGSGLSCGVRRNVVGTGCDPNRRGRL